MGRCLLLVGLLAVAAGALVACDGPMPPQPATYTTPDAEPWTVFVGDEGIGGRFSPHARSERLTQVETYRRLPRETIRWNLSWPGELELWAGGDGARAVAAHLAVPPKRGATFDRAEDLAMGDVAALRRRLALAPRLRDRATSFAAEPEVPWLDVEAWWANVVAASPRPAGLRICGASTPDRLRPGGPVRSKASTALVVEFLVPFDATGRSIEVVTDDAVAGPFPPVTIRSGGAEFRFPGGDPYATKDNVEAANRSWRALAAALRDPAAGRARPADLAIGPRVPWAHVAQLLATLADVGITRLRMPDRPYGLELRFAALSGGDLDDLAAWDFPRASPWPWIGAGLALAGLFGVAAWAPWERLRRRGRVSDRATR